MAAAEYGKATKMVEASSVRTAFVPDPAAADGTYVVRSDDVKASTQNIEPMTPQTTTHTINRLTTHMQQERENLQRGHQLNADEA